MTSPPDTRSPGGTNQTGAKSAIDDSDFYTLPFSSQMAEIQAIIDELAKCSWWQGMAAPTDKEAVQ